MQINAGNLTDPDLPPFGIVDIEDPPASVIYDEMLNTTVDNGVDPMPIGLLDDFPTVLENNLNLLNCDKVFVYAEVYLSLHIDASLHLGSQIWVDRAAYHVFPTLLHRTVLQPT